MIFTMFVSLVYPYLVLFEIYVVRFMLNVLRCSSYSSFFWVLIRFDKKFLCFFLFDFILDSGFGFGLFYSRIKSFGSTLSGQNQVND